MRFSAVVCSAFLVFLLSPEVVRAQMPQSAHPLRSLHLSFVALDDIEGRSFDEGSLRLQNSLVWGNTSEKEDNFTIDVEQLRIENELLWALDEDYGVFFRLPLIVRGGGVADSFIESWHETFSLPNGDRGRLSDGEYEVSGIQSDGNRFSIDEQGFGISNPSIGLYYEPELFSSERFQFEISLPALSDEFGHQGIDLLFGLHSNHSSGAWDFELGAALLWFSDTEIKGLSFREFHPEGLLGIGYSLSDRFSLYTQGRLSGETLRSLENYPSFIFIQDFGLSYLFDNGDKAFLALREDLAGSEGTSDVELILSYRLFI